MRTWNRWVTCVLIMVMVGMWAAPVLAGITATGSSVSIDVDFLRKDYGKGATCKWAGHDVAWNPGDTSEACTPPTGMFEEKASGTSFAHFKILDASGDCILFNSLLGNATSDTGWMDIIFNVPVGEEITTQNVNFAPSSDYVSITLNNYYQQDGFYIERGETYVFQITEQVQGCEDPSDDGELVKVQQVLTIPCCIGMRGNANNDPYDQVNIGDCVAIVNCVNGMAGIVCPEEADVDGDGDVDIDDAYYLIDYIFNGGPAPVDCTTGPSDPMLPAGCQ